MTRRRLPAAVVAILWFVSCQTTRGAAAGPPTATDRHAPAALAGKWARAEDVGAALGFPAGFPAGGPAAMEFSLDDKPGARWDEDQAKEMKAAVGELKHTMVATARVRMGDKPAGDWVITHHDGATYGCAVVPNAGLVANRLSLVPGAAADRDLLFVEWDVPAGKGRTVSAYRRADAPARADAKDAPRYEVRTIDGWTVHVNRRLLESEKEDTAKMIGLLTDQLAAVVKAVPAPAVEELRKVPLWVNPEYPGVRPVAEYHPDAGWLRANGRDPAMAKGVEFTDVRTFDREVVRMPVVVLHELAHGYHDRLLGFDNPDVKACYERAKANGSYDNVERFHAPGVPITKEKAYAMTNPQEYFAECSEAFFGRNDFYPFTRDELEKHDPEMFKLLDRLWNRPTPEDKRTDSPRRRGERRDESK